MIILNAQRVLVYIYGQLSSSLKQSKKAKELKFFLDNESVEIGKTLIDFEVKTINNEKFKLSSLKGKYIYLIFWSSGCGACRHENIYLSKNFKKISKDIEIVSFSMDHNINHLKIASKKDSIVWTNTYDNKIKTEKIKTLYNVQSLPTSYLIDKQGVVVEKMIFFENQIIDKINKIIGENK